MFKERYEAWPSGSGEIPLGCCETGGRIWIKNVAKNEKVGYIYLQTPAACWLQLSHSTPDQFQNFSSSLITDTQNNHLKNRVQDEKKQSDPLN